MKVKLWHGVLKMLGYSLFQVVPSTQCFTSKAATFLRKTGSVYRIQTCGAKKVVGSKKSKVMVKEELKGPEVCKDAVRLTTYAVGVNILKQGEDPQLKPFEEYPEWLFQLNLGKALHLHEMEPDTWAYWRRLRKENIWRHNKLSEGKKF